MRETGATWLADARPNQANSSELPVTTRDATLTGVLGWIGIRPDDGPRLLGSMIERAGIAPDRQTCSALDEAHAVAAIGPNATIFTASRGRNTVVIGGHPFWRGLTADGPDDAASRLLDAYLAEGATAFAKLGGDYAAAIVAPDAGRAILAVDRMAVRNIVYVPTGDGVVFGPSTDVVCAHPAVTRDVDAQSLYNYLYFHVVPGPDTIFRGHLRLLPGQHIELKSGKWTLGRHWHASFDETADGPFRSLKQTFRGALDKAVKRRLGEKKCGAFLSGGTDSSTISGLLTQATASAAETFSIGFDAAGFDEMAYARIAARHFGSSHHEYYVTPADVVEALPRIAAAYSQPFGNASAVPTYYCARRAAETGVARMFAGDGGDELFGGNARYAKQYQFAFYDHLPRSVRDAVVEPLARRLAFAESMPLVRKARSYVAQAALPMPERYNSYNLLERLDPTDVLEPDFLASIDRMAPHRLAREIYTETDANSLINRMLALDFRITLADSDLPKVTTMCELAGVDVVFPMLDDDVIDFSLGLGPQHKLRGQRLRPFFKEALRDFLPPQILTKEKHGFGLPVGAWLISYAPLRSLAGDSLATLRRRHIVRPEFIDRLLDRHLAEHAEYYGTMVWILMMLEMWFDHHADRRSR